ncbi:cyclic lactone autoinducer peptide [Metabacillus crassostreae]|nr:cyclic lactone autoinducer peptide [Metabacillus crassostreae]MBM7606622.1 cyclic lactone autoinducer peptide [Metabacillus crassostreae]
MLKYLKGFKHLAIMSAAAFIGIAESSVNIMCLGLFDEIELPEELKNIEL